MKKKIDLSKLAEIREIRNENIQALTGKKQRTCSRTIKVIREKLQKKPGEKLTIAEYARYCGLDPVQVCTFLGIEE
ncbi:MAG: hypothetical protein J7621_18055 [Niastella sp.]|nr:hypothetical protein [Niastella sp.]